MKYILLLMILSVQVIHYGNSQESSRFDLFAGYGFYEGIHTGAIYNFKAISHSAGLFFGFDRIFNKKEVYFALTPEYKIAFLRKRINKFDQYKWYLDGKAVFWYLDDEYYTWWVVTFIPSLARNFCIGEKLGISVDAGPAFNLVMHTHRKTFREVGWPYHVMPNMRIIAVFSL